MVVTIDRVLRRLRELQKELALHKDTVTLRKIAHELTDLERLLKEMAWEKGGSDEERPGGG